MGLMKKINKKTRTFCAVFDRSTTLCEVDQFVDKFRKETDKKDEFVVDVNLSKTGHKVFWRNIERKNFTINDEKTISIHLSAFKFIYKSAFFR